MSEWSHAAGLGARAGGVGGRAGAGAPRRGTPGDVTPIAPDVRRRGLADRCPRRPIDPGWGWGRLGAVQRALPARDRGVHGPRCRAAVRRERRAGGQCGRERARALRGDPARRRAVRRGSRTGRLVGRRPRRVLSPHRHGVLAVPRRARTRIAGADDDVLLRDRRGRVARRRPVSAFPRSPPQGCGTARVSGDGRDGGDPEQSAVRRLGHGAALPRPGRPLSHHSRGPAPGSRADRLACRGQHPRLPRSHSLLGMDRELRRGLHPARGMDPLRRVLRRPRDRSAVVPRRGARHGRRPGADAARGRADGSRVGRR